MSVKSNHRDTHANAFRLIILLFAIATASSLLVATPAHALRVLVLFRDDSGWFQDSMPPAEKECPGAAKPVNGLSIHLIINDTKFYSVANASCSEVLNLGENGTYTAYTTLGPKMYDLNIQEESVISVDLTGNMHVSKANLLPADFCGDRMCLKDELCQIDCRILPSPSCGNRLCEAGEYCGNCTDCGCGINEHCMDNTTCVSWTDVSECGNRECETGETPEKCAMDCQKTLAFVCENLTEYETSLVSSLRKNGFAVSTLESIPETFRDFNGIVIAGRSETPHYASPSELEALVEFVRSGGCVAFVKKGPVAIAGGGTGWQLESSVKDLLASERLVNSTHDRLRFEEDSSFGSGEFTLESKGLGLEGVSNDTNTSIIASWTDGPVFALNRTYGAGRAAYWSTTEEYDSLASGFIKALKYCTNASVGITTGITAGAQAICGDDICSDEEDEEETCCEDCGCALGAGIKCVEGKCTGKDCYVNEEQAADAVIRLGRARVALLKAAMKTRLELKNESLAERLETLANNVSLASGTLGSLDFKDCGAAFGTDFSKKLQEFKAESSKIMYALTAIMVSANKEKDGEDNQ